MYTSLIGVVMTDSYQIRQLRIDDLMAVYQLNLACFSQDDAYPQYYFWSLYQNSEYHYVIVDHTQTIVGFLMTAYFDDDELPNDLNSGHSVDCLPNCELTNHHQILGISTIAIRNRDRKHGLAQRLLTNLIEQVISTSDLIKSIVLQVRVSNHYAIRAYTKVGFQQSFELLSKYYSHPTEDGYLMIYQIQNN